METMPPLFTNQMNSKQQSEPMELSRRDARRMYNIIQRDFKTVNTWHSAMIAAGSLTATFLVVFVVGKKLTSLVISIFGLVWVCLSYVMYTNLRNRMIKKWVTLA